jgi:hypothetical protein
MSYDGDRFLGPTSIVRSSSLRITFECYFAALVIQRRSVGTTYDSFGQSNIRHAEVDAIRRTQPLTKMT